MTGVDPFEERIQQNRIARNNRIYERQQIVRRQRSPQEYAGYDAATGLHRLRGAEGDRLVSSITTGALEAGAIVRSGPGSVSGLEAAQPLVFERERRSVPLSTRFYTISSNTLNENIITVYQVDVSVPRKTADIRVSYRWTPLDPTPEEADLNSGVITNGVQLGNAQICCIPDDSLTPRYLVAANPILGTWVEIDSLSAGQQNLFWSYTLNSQGDRAYCGYTVNIAPLTWRTRILEFSPTDYTIYRRIDAGLSDLRDDADPPWTIAEVGGLLYVNGDVFGLLFIDLETEAKTVIFNTQDLPETTWLIDGYETVFVQQVFKKDEETIGVFLLSSKDGEPYFGIATANIFDPANFSYELIYSASVGTEIDIENPKIFYSKKTRTYYFLGYPNVSTPSTGLEDYNYLGYWRSGDVPQFLKLRYAPGQSEEDRALILQQWTNGVDELIFLNIDGRFEV